MSEKAQIRSRILAARGALAKEECAQRSALICEKFLQSDEYLNAETLFLYKAYNNEVDTDAIFKKAVSDGKIVCYPKSEIVDGMPDLRFYMVDDLSLLSEGYKGIYEPDGKDEGRLFTKSADVCVAPGVAFDRMCHRIGYGKGFYDKYLSDNPQKTVIALAYDMQIVDDFEPDDNDRNADMVITESAVYANG